MCFATISESWCSPSGATADAFTLFERLEMKIEEHNVRSGASLPSRLVTHSRPLCVRVPSRRLLQFAGFPLQQVPRLPAVWVQEGAIKTGVFAWDGGLRRGNSPAHAWIWRRRGAWTSTCAGLMCGAMRPTPPCCSLSSVHAQIQNEQKKQCIGEETAGNCR